MDMDMDMGMGAGGLSFCTSDGETRPHDSTCAGTFPMSDVRLQILLHGKHVDSVIPAEGQHKWSGNTDCGLHVAVGDAVGMAMGGA